MLLVIQSKTANTQVALAIAGVSERGPQGIQGATGQIGPIGLATAYLPLRYDSAGRSIAIDVGSGSTIDQQTKYDDNGNQNTSGTKTKASDDHVVLGNDYRLSNTRLPSGTITDTSGDLTGSYPNPSLKILNPSPAQASANLYKMTIDANGRVLTTTAAIGTDLPSHTHTSFNNGLSLNGDLSLSTHRITGLVTDGSSNPTDAVNKQYVDQVAVGINVHPSVKYATTGAITLSGLTNQTNFDTSNALTSGDRILVKNQSSAKDNGIYVAASGSWSRATDMSGTGIANWRSSVNGVVGAYVFVDNGTANVNTSWLASVTNVGTESIDTDSINFSKFSSISITAGNGISQLGSSISVKPATSNSGLSFDGAGGLKVSGTIDGTATWNGNIIGLAYGGLGVNVSSNKAGARTNLGLGNVSTEATIVSRTTQSFSIQGNVGASNLTTRLGAPSFFASKGFNAPSTGTSTTVLESIICRLGSGTNAQFRLHQLASGSWNGTVLSDSTAISAVGTITATTTAASSTPSSTVAISDGDEIVLDITRISGTPQNLSVTLVFKHTLSPSP